jgi:hypoxanthine-guanine phosphoribosyltransferase
MNDIDHHDQIVRLEAQIDELVATIESWRKFILVGRIAVVGGGVVLITMFLSAIQFDPSVMVLAVAAVLGGIVAAGSNRRTAKDALHDLSAAETKRTALIEQIDFRLVPDRDGFQ